MLGAWLRLGEGRGATPAQIRLQPRSALGRGRLRRCYQVLFSWGYRGGPRGAEGQAKVCCRGTGPCREPSGPLAFAVPHRGMETWHHLRRAQAHDLQEHTPLQLSELLCILGDPAQLAPVLAGRPGAPPRGYLGSKSRTILENPGWLASGHISHK